MLFKTPTLDDDELRVVARIDDARQSLRYAVSLSRRWTGNLRRMALAKAIRGSNSIEGYNVTKDDAMAVVDEEEPLDANDETRLAVNGYRDAMTYVLQLADDPHFSYSRSLIRSLHYMMIRHTLAKNPGKWRPGPIFVVDEATGQRVYEGPDEDINGLMLELVNWLNERDDTHCLVKAAMAHLNLVMIHPFSDGNGRMGRCLQTLVLAREQILAPAFSSIEEYLGKNQRAYYDVLAEVGAGSWHPERNARPWVRFCLTAHYRQANALLRLTRILSRLWDGLEAEVKALRLPDRMLPALSDAALGYKIRNASYRHLADVSDTLAGRDLRALVQVGLFVPEGERRGRHYVASEKLRAIGSSALEPKRDKDDPFALTGYLPGLAPI